MGKSIFELNDKFSIDSPWENNWENEEFVQNSTSSLSKQSVQKYNHPHITKFDSAYRNARKEHHNKFLEYKAYYVKIGKVKESDSWEDVYSVFSEANKVEMQRLKDKILDNKAYKKEAEALKKKWNKLDSELTNVVYEFNEQEGFDNNDRLDPNLVKALMFSETEIGTSVEYLEKVATYPTTRPNALYHLNLGRVTDANVYNSVKKEFNIPVDWKTNYKDLGNKNDVMLCAGALIQKRRVALQYKSNSNFKKNQPWFNAVVAYKGAVAEGARKAELVWKLYTSGAHPYTSKFKLF